MAKTSATPPDATELIAALIRIGAKSIARVAIGDMAVPARARVCGTSDGFGFHGS